MGKVLWVGEKNNEGLKRVKVEVLMDGLLKNEEKI